MEWRRSVSGVRLRGSVCPLGESAPPVHPALPQPSSRCRCHHRCPTDIRCARWLTARARARRTSITADDRGAAAQNRQRRQTAPAAASAEQSQWCHCHCHCHCPCARSLVRCLSLPSCLQCHGGVRVWRCAVGRRIDNNWAGRSAVSALSGLSCRHRQPDWTTRETQRAREMSKKGATYFMHSQREWGYPPD